MEILTRGAPTTYTPIEKHLKGLNISRESRNLLRAAYGVDMPMVAKLLANYNWSHTHDTTLILITTALLVVGEVATYNLTDNIDENKIKNLFIAMAKGNGDAAKTNVNCLHNLFKSVLGHAKNMNDGKIESVWTKYQNHIGNITPWKYSVDAVVDNVKPILKLSLIPHLYDAFKNNLLLVEGEEQGAKEEFDNITKKLFNNEKSIDVGGNKVKLHIFEQGTTDTPQLTSRHIGYVKIKHNGIATYYKIDESYTQTIGFNSNSLRILMRRNKLNSVKKLRNFLVKHIKSLFKKMDKDLNSVVASARKELRSSNKKLHLRMRLVDSNDFVSSEYKSGHDIDVPKAIRIKYQLRRADDPNDLEVILDKSQLATLYYSSSFGSDTLKDTIVETIKILSDVISNNDGNNKNDDDTDSETDSGSFFLDDEEAEMLLDLEEQNRENIMSKIKEHEFVKELLKYDAVKKQLAEDYDNGADGLFSLVPYKVYMQILGLILIAKGAEEGGVPPDKREEFENKADKFISDMDKLNIPLE